MNSIGLPCQICSSRSSGSSMRTCCGVSHLPKVSELLLTSWANQTCYLPKQRSSPPMNAMAWSMTHNFSCCLYFRILVMKWKWGIYSHVPNKRFHWGCERATAASWYLGVDQLDESWRDCTKVSIKYPRPSTNVMIYLLSVGVVLLDTSLLRTWISIG